MQKFFLELFLNNKKKIFQTSQKDEYENSSFFFLFNFCFLLEKKMIHFN